MPFSLIDEKLRREEKRSASGTILALKCRGKVSLESWNASKCPVKGFDRLGAHVEPLSRGGRGRVEGKTGNRKSSFCRGEGELRRILRNGARGLAASLHITEPRGRIGLKKRASEM